MSLFLWPPSFPSPSMVTFSQLVACSVSWPMVDFMEIAQSWGWHCDHLSCNICLYVYVPCMHVCMVKCMWVHMYGCRGGACGDHRSTFGLFFYCFTPYLEETLTEPRHWLGWTGCYRTVGMPVSLPQHAPLCFTYGFCASRLILMLAQQAFPHWATSPAQLCVLKIKISVCKRIIWRLIPGESDFLSAWFSVFVVIEHRITESGIINVF